MKYILILACLVSFAVSARTPEEKKALLEAQTSCANFVRFDDHHLFLGNGAYQRWGEFPRTPIPSYVTIAQFDKKGTQQIDTNDSSIDVVVDNGHLFILTFSGIEEWDLATMTKVADHQSSTVNSNEYKSHAESWARYQDTMVIAHGSQGVTFFDLKSKKLTGQVELLRAQLPLESQATAVSIIGTKAYVSLDSLSLTNEAPFPFKGVIILDLTTRKVVMELDGMDPGVDASTAFGDKLIVSFYGMPIWKYDVSKFKGKKLPNPDIRVFRYPAKGHPIGSATMDEKYYYTCFRFEDGIRPTTINRKELLLD